MQGDHEGEYYPPRPPFESSTMILPPSDSHGQSLILPKINPLIFGVAPAYCITREGRLVAITGPSFATLAILANNFVIVRVDCTGSCLLLNLKGVLFLATGRDNLLTADLHGHFIRVRVTFVYLDLRRRRRFALDKQCPGGKFNRNHPM